MSNSRGGKTFRKDHRNQLAWVKKGISELKTLIKRNDQESIANKLSKMKEICSVYGWLVRLSANKKRVLKYGF